MRLLDEAIYGEMRPAAFVLAALSGMPPPLADMTLMFYNSRSLEKAFAVVRAQWVEALPTIRGHEESALGEHGMRCLLLGPACAVAAAPGKPYVSRGAK